MYGWYADATEWPIASAIALDPVAAIAAPSATRSHLSLAILHDSIEQGGLAHVGEAHDACLQRAQGGAAAERAHAFLHERCAAQRPAPRYRAARRAGIHANGTEVAATQARCAARGQVGGHAALCPHSQEKQLQRKRREVSSAMDASNGLKATLVV